MVATSERGERASFNDERRNQKQGNWQSRCSSRRAVTCCRQSKPAILGTLKVLIHKAEEGGYWAEVPALPGCVSQGETIDDVRTNVREAIEGWLLAEEGTTQAKADRVLEVTV